MPDTFAADLVFTGGPVLTGDAARSRATTVAVRGDRIIAVGHDEVRELIGPRTEVVDLAGRLLVPGFQDAHVHPVGGGHRARPVRPHRRGDHRGVPRRIRAYADAHPAGVDHRRRLVDGGVPRRYARPRRAARRASSRTGPPTCSTATTTAPGSTPAPWSWPVSTAATPRPGRRPHRARRDGAADRDAPGGRDGPGRPTSCRARPPTSSSPRCCGPRRCCTRYGITAWQDAIVGGFPADGRRTPAYLTAAARRHADRPGRRRAVVGPRARRRADPGAGRPAANGCSHGRFRATTREDHAGRHRGEPHRRDARPLPRRLRLRHRQHRHLSFVDPEALRDRTSPRSTRTASRCTSTRSATAPCARRSTRSRRHARANGRTRHPAPPRPPPGRPPRRRRRASRARRHRQHPAAVGRARTADGRADDPVPRRRTRRAGSTRSATCCAAGATLAAGSDWPVSSPDPIQGIHVAVNRTASRTRSVPGVPARASASTWPRRSPRTPRAART